LARQTPAPKLNKPQKNLAPLIMPSPEDSTAKIIEHIQILAHQSQTVAQIDAHIQGLDTKTSWQDLAVCPLFMTGALQPSYVVIYPFPTKAQEEKEQQDNQAEQDIFQQSLAYILGHQPQISNMNGFFWRPLVAQLPDNAYEYSVPFCKKALSLIKPQKIIFAGAKIAQIFLETKQSIMALRGKKHILSCYDVPLEAYVTFHPQEIEGGMIKKLFWQDMLQLIK